MATIARHEAILHAVMTATGGVEPPVTGQLELGM
jgi:hypothetical protein